MDELQNDGVISSTNMSIENGSSSEELNQENRSYGDFIVTGEQLLKMKQETFDYLVKDLLPRTGAVAMVGSSDTDKSSFLRQLACSIVRKETTFIGFDIIPRHNRVIYVSTEDDRSAMAFLLNKQKLKEEQSKDLSNLLFVFESEGLLKKLDKTLKQYPADCVIIDAFTDIYSGDMIAANKVRSFINEFVDLSKKHSCLFIFLHHTGKRTEYFEPSKDNILGSQGFEAKMRLVLELRKDFANIQKRHLCIVKGNYVPEKGKEQSYVLSFDDNMLYSSTGERVSFNLLAKPEPKKQENNEAKARAIELKKLGYTITKIHEEMATKGFKYAKSTIGGWVKDCPVDQLSLGDGVGERLDGGVSPSIQSDTLGEMDGGSKTDDQHTERDDNNTKE